jgi:hypothetical protein
MPPSFEHEAWIMLVQNRPELAGELVRDILGRPMPDYGEVSLSSEDTTEVVLANKRADAVVVFHALDPAKPPAMAVIVEVQRGEDTDKHYSWLVYIALVRARLKCPVMLLVLCPDVTITRWCSRSIPTGHPRLELTPLVCDTSMIPAITEPKEAAHSPELAVLSAIAHGAEPEGVDVLRALLKVIGDLDHDRACKYADVVLKLLPGETAKHLWEDLMATGTYEYQSDFARRYVAEGKAEGKAEDVIRVLTARGFTVSDALRDNVNSITDIAVLDTLIERAVTCETPDSLLP